MSFDHAREGMGPLDLRMKASHREVLLGVRF